MAGPSLPSFNQPSRVMTSSRNGGRGARHGKYAVRCQQPARATKAGAAEGVEHGIDAARASRRTAATRSGASRSSATLPGVCLICGAARTHLMGINIESPPIWRWHDVLIFYYCAQAQSNAD